LIWNVDLSIEIPLYIKLPEMQDLSIEIIIYHYYLQVINNHSQQQQQQQHEKEQLNNHNHSPEPSAEDHAGMFYIDFDASDFTAALDPYIPLQLKWHFKRKDYISHITRLHNS
jgi:hypothetical protein